MRISNRVKAGVISNWPFSADHKLLCSVVTKTTERLLAADTLQQQDCGSAIISVTVTVTVSVAVTVTVNVTLTIIVTVIITVTVTVTVTIIVTVTITVTSNCNC